MKVYIGILVSIVLLANVSGQVSGEILPGTEGSQSFVSVQGMIFNTIGHFKDAWKEGSGGYIGYGTVYTNYWALTFHTGYITFTHNEDLNYTGDPKFTIIPLMVGGRYYLLLDTFRPFLLANGGINIITEDYRLDDKLQDLTRAKTHFQVGAGIGICLISTLEIELQAKYNSHLLEPHVPYNITGLEYGAALNWFLR